jgi:hypothetical protein
MLGALSFFARAGPAEEMKRLKARISARIISKYLFFLILHFLLGIHTTVRFSEKSFLASNILLMIFPVSEIRKST